MYSQEPIPNSPSYGNKDSDLSLSSINNNTNTAYKHDNYTSRDISHSPSSSNTHFSTISMPNQNQNKVKSAVKSKQIYITIKDSANTISRLESSLDISLKVKDTKNNTRIQCVNPANHSKLVKYLSSDCKNLKSHTFQVTHKKPFHAVIRHLHKTTPTKWICDQLATLGYLVSSISTIKDRHTKQPLDLFQLIILCNNSSVIKQLLELKSLGNCQIAIEPQISHQVPQCHRCQRFGHTKNYCNRPYTCVKCAGNHLSVSCTKTHYMPPKCANCKGKHTANYLGCAAYKKATILMQSPNHFNWQTATSTNQCTKAKTTTPNPTKSQNKMSSSIFSRFLTSVSSGTQKLIRNLSYAAVAAQQQLSNAKLKPHRPSNLQLLQKPTKYQQSTTRNKQYSRQLPTPKTTAIVSLSHLKQTKSLLPSHNAVTTSPHLHYRFTTPSKPWHSAQRPPTIDKHSTHSSLDISAAEDRGYTPRKPEKPFTSLATSLQRLLCSITTLNNSLSQFLSLIKAQANPAKRNTQVNTVINVFAAT